MVGWIFSGGPSNVDGLMEKVEGVEYAPDNAEDACGDGVASRGNEVEANGDNGPGDADGTDTGIETRLTLAHLKPRLKTTEGLDISPNPRGKCSPRDQRTEDCQGPHGMEGSEGMANIRWRVIVREVL